MPCEKKIKPNLLALCDYSLERIPTSLRSIVSLFFPHPSGPDINWSNYYVRSPIILDNQLENIITNRNNYLLVKPDHMLNPIAGYKNCSRQVIAVRTSTSASKIISQTRCIRSKFQNVPINIMVARLAASGATAESLKDDKECGDDTPLEDDEPNVRPLMRHGRRYLGDHTLPYPLPTDLAEAHRQTLRTLLLCQVFGGPLCSTAFNKNPPTSVLEVACGTGFWSEMCHRYFSERGHSSVSFTGIDIEPLAMFNEASGRSNINWNFVQHDLRKLPLPFQDEQFSLVMVKDLSLVTPSTGLQQMLMEEYIRILKPAGTLEIWDGDHSIRMLLPHVQPIPNKDCADKLSAEDGYTNPAGTYFLNLKTPLVAPRNPYLIEYNSWIAKALESRTLTAMPCTAILSLLHQESGILEEIQCRRLAIPFGELWWERQGNDELLALDISDTKGKARTIGIEIKDMTSMALRRTALVTVVQMMESLDPLLHEASGKGELDWDDWMTAMMSDLLESNNTSGECLEVGAWWATKRLVPFSS